MGAEQSLIGGTKRKRDRNETFEAYKAVRKMLEEQGKDFENQVFLDLPDARVLKRLGIFEDCDVFDDIDCRNSIKNIVINGHGRLVERKEKPKEDDPPQSVTVPENIVVLFMGELGHITWTRNSKNIIKDICNKELVPNQIGLPGSKIPNVRLSAEHKKNKKYSTGIYDCDLEKNDILNQFEGFEHYLIPTEKKVIDTMKPEVKKMLKKSTQEGKKIINSVTLNEILPEISKKIPKDKYGFVYVFSCLGVCKTNTQKEIELYTKPTGLSPVRGYTVKKIPARVDVSRYSLGDGKKWNPVLTNDRNIITARNWVIRNYNNFNISDKTFIEDFKDNTAFKFDENWRQHLPDINSDFIQNTKSKIRKSAFVNHFKFIDLLHEGDLEKIEKAWNMQFEDKTKFLLVGCWYYFYSKRKKLDENIIKLIDELVVRKRKNTEIIENIGAPVNEIKKLIEHKNLEDLKKLMFQYMKDAVDGDMFKNIKYQDIYEDEEGDEEVLNVVEAHDIYQYTIVYGDFSRDDKYLIENKDRLKNALDIKPYMDYMNGDEYVPPDKGYVIEKMNKLRDLLGFPRVQQGGMVGSVGSVGSVGMWQRGGFFMTCS